MQINVPHRILRARLRLRVPLKLEARTIMLRTTTPKITMPRTQILATQLMAMLLPVPPRTTTEPRIMWLAMELKLELRMVPPRTTEGLRRPGRLRRSTGLRRRTKSTSLVGKTSALKATVQHDTVLVTLAFHDGDGRKARCLNRQDIIPHTICRLHVKQFTMFRSRSVILTPCFSLP